MTPLIGRARERALLDAALERIGKGGLVAAVDGEPGIGKSRLLAELGERAGAAGCRVVGAAASEFEDDLPYGIWTEALDPYLRTLGDRAISRLGLEDSGALAGFLPVLGEPVAVDRHRVHRALRDLLERLAGPRPLVLWLDDLHWADPGSIDALAALVRRPPGGAVLLALAARERRWPPPLTSALAGAGRENRVTRLALTPLTEAEAAELVGRDVAPIYRTSGGNPFYLEQLARTETPRGDSPPSGLPAARGVRPPLAVVPEAVALAIEAELAQLGPETRLMLDAAAVVGDPFDPALAAEVAELPEEDALSALDDLLERTLVRPTGAARRFAFRHPVVRHAVYEGAPGGWRLGAHTRAAAALERRGAGIVARAHHVEHAAQPGDDLALATLETAARELHGRAPASAARFLATALRLVPDEHRERRMRVHVALAEAQSASGSPEEARATLLDALGHAQTQAERHSLTVRVANTEFWLGRDEEALRRLHVALGGLPAEPSEERVRLHFSLGLNLVHECAFEMARAQASDALADIRVLGDPLLEWAGRSLEALCAAAVADPATAAARAQADAALKLLGREELMTRLPALWMTAWVDSRLGRFSIALDSLQQARQLATETGRELVLVLVSGESVRVLRELGRLAEALVAAEEAVDRARLAGSPQQLLWAQTGLASAHLATGDVAAALRAAEDALELDARRSLHTAGEPGWCLGAALVAAGNPERGVPALLTAFGGPALPELIPADRPAAAADLVDAQLAAGDLAGAQATLAHVEQAGRTPYAAALVGRARAEILLAEGRPHDAVAAARGATAYARDPAVHAPLAAALARLVEGRALSAAGDRAAARTALTEAEAALDGFGARRRRDEAVRELRRLGHRVVRPARDGDGGPLGGLTAREREIAMLVADGRTNREVAEQLVLSAKTIEAHLRNIYAKLGVRSRVELAREAERAQGPG